MSDIKSFAVRLGPKKPKKWYQRFWEWLEPPSPLALGRANYNALPMRGFVEEDAGYTWEDWHEEVSKDYPVRYFLTNTLVRVFSLYYRQYVTDPIYWVKCHTLKSYRFHLLDLRNPAPDIKYTHGYMDPCEVLLWASFVILKDYIEKEEPRNPRDDFDDETLATEPYLSEKTNYDEAMALYNWWMKGRFEEENESMRLYNQYKAVKTTPERAAACKAWMDHTTYQETREQEMLLRLVAIRKSLWT